MSLYSIVFFIFLLLFFFISRCKDQKIQWPKPTLSSELYSPALAQINKFSREGNRQQGGALSEDENKGEMAYIIE